jgi:hypothetical protein
MSNTKEEGAIGGNILKLMKGKIKKFLDNYFK